MIHCRSLSATMPSDWPMAGSAGSMESMASALTAISAAISATNWRNPMPPPAAPGCRCCSRTLSVSLPRAPRRRAWGRHGVCHCVEAAVPAPARPACRSRHRPILRDDQALPGGIWLAAWSGGCPRRCGSGASPVGNCRQGHRSSPAGRRAGYRRKRRFLAPDHNRATADEAADGRPSSTEAGGHCCPVAQQRRKTRPDHAAEIFLNAWEKAQIDSAVSSTISMMKLAIRRQQAHVGLVSSFGSACSPSSRLSAEPGVRLPRCSIHPAIPRGGLLL